MVELQDLFIGPDDAIVAALRKMDDTAKGILLVVDDEEKLLGTLTDGDIRRCILRNGSLDSCVSDAVFRTPAFVEIGCESEARAMLSERGLDAIPVLDEKGRVVSCVMNERELAKPPAELSDDVPVVMMAGGKGTRLYPYTKILPKALIPVNDIPIAERIINQFVECGCSRFFLVVNHKKEMVKAYFREIEREYEIRFVDEEVFLGTGGGLRLLEGLINETFILTNCDILVKANMAEALEIHRSRGNAITMLASLKNYQIPYGTVEIDVGGGISSMLEKPTIPFLVNTGCYIVEPAVFGMIGDGESVDFPDLIDRCKAQGLNVGVYPISEKSWLDMGQLDELRQMSAALDS